MFFSTPSFCCGFAVVLLSAEKLRGKRPPSLRNPFLLLGAEAASRPADGPRCRSQAPLQAQLAPRVWPQVAAFRQHDLTSWFPRITLCLPCCLSCAAPGLPVGPGWLPQPGTGQLQGSGLCQVSHPRLLSSCALGGEAAAQEGLQDLADFAELFWRRENLKPGQSDPSKSRGWHGITAWADHSPENQFGAVTLSQHRGHIWGWQCWILPAPESCIPLEVGATFVASR